MKIITTADFQIEEPTVVAIGKFDGFHLGHQKLLKTLMEQKEKGLASVVFTFIPSPAAFFSKKVLPELSTIEEKRSIFEQAGVDYLIECPFNQIVADTDPQAFIEQVLHKQIGAKCVVAGEDVSYGKMGRGDYKLLQDKASVYDYEVILIEKVLFHDREISSTFVREAVKDGDLKLVQTLLGQPYTVSGEIVHGRKLGRTIGMPTVNLIPPQEKLLPPKGVYYSRTLLDGKTYRSITNIGTKPTVDGQKMGVETYIYDFNQDVYGKYAVVELLEFKRPEMKFASVEQLKLQMQSDILSGKTYQ